MKKNVFKLSSKQIMLTSVLASAFIVGYPQQSLAGVTSVNAVQQSNVVKGRVLDANGEPVIGATVKVQGTQNATVTDLDGNYTLNNVSGGQLVISYIGYQSQTVDVRGKSSVNVTLKEDNKTLNEVVVVGYGTQKKANLTGAVSSVSVDDLGDRPITNSSTLL